tara:strand:+ start:2270 stop:3478 length:1209 start_codon:yes stop_codon:yes gene_type:complete
MQENSPSFGFLNSNLVDVDSIELGNFTIPASYDIENSLAPGTFYGQKRRLAQLQEIKDSSRNEPIKWDIRAALANENQNMFKSDEAQGSENIRTKIDELNFDNGNTSVADHIASLADSLVQSSQANYLTVADNGIAGMITTGTKKRHVSANGLEYAEILEKSLYGALMYDQMVDDYLSDSQSGINNEEGNNVLSAEDYELYGTERQHKFDEAFGYFGAEAATYPNQVNSSVKDGIFLANYTFDFSDETEAMYGVNLAKATMNAFIVGRSVLKAGQGNDSSQENINEELFNAARVDIKLYVEAGLAASAIHYLNKAITNVSKAEKLHHLSEALGFIYAMSFNSEGRLTPEESHTALTKLDWSASDSSLNGVYDINLWDITDEQMNMAIDVIDESFPGFKNAGF